MMRTRSVYYWAALCLAGLLFCCRQNYTRQDPLLSKPVKDLSDEEIARMVVAVKTNLGEFRFELRPDWAPQTTRHFLTQVHMGSYVGTTFHQVRPWVWALAGDPQDDPKLTGFQMGLEENVPTRGPAVRGSVGLYHPDYIPEEGGTRFFVMLGDWRKLDGEYNFFGRVIEGMATVDRIGAVPVTCESCEPKPYQPLTPIDILDVVLELKK
jgi:cyclophilin family peptidyl-prolyl cis-trans isomerase